MTRTPRQPREIGTRESDLHMEYKPPSALPDPKPEPGFTYHWVATHVLGKADPSNMSKKFVDGWEPVVAGEQPSLAHLATPDGQIALGGLLLCRMPTERYQARKAYYERQAVMQMASVDQNLMRESDSRMPIFKEGKSTVTRGQSFGNGS